MKRRRRHPLTCSHYLPSRTDCHLLASARCLPRPSSIGKKLRGPPCTAGARSRRACGHLVLFFSAAVGRGRGGVETMQSVVRSVTYRPAGATQPSRVFLLASSQLALWVARRPVRRDHAVRAGTGGGVDRRSTKTKDRRHKLMHLYRYGRRVRLARADGQAAAAGRARAWTAADGTAARGSKTTARLTHLVALAGRLAD